MFPFGRAQVFLLLEPPLELVNLLLSEQNATLSSLGKVGELHGADAHADTDADADAHSHT